jgi:hypothetical protein
MSDLIELKQQARALRARVTSYFKSGWTLDHYPIYVRIHPTSGTAGSSRARPLPWFATILDWPGLSGGADSGAEALADLRQNSDKFKRNNKLPRPGTKVSVQFASTKRIDAHAALAKDFIKRVLELD